MSVVAFYVNVLVTVLWVAILARVLISWLPMGSQSHPMVGLIYQITEPILAPIRRLVPRIGMLDLTPMIAIMILFAIRWLVNRVA